MNACSFPLIDTLGSRVFSTEPRNPLSAAPLSAALADAVIWVLRNRVEAGRAFRRRTGAAHAEFGGGALPDAARGLARRLLAETAALAALRAGLAEAEASAADPTGGALYFHHHACCPAWAVPLKATALIGPFLFLTLPERTEKE